MSVYKLNMLQSYSSGLMYNMIYTVLVIPTSLSRFCSNCPWWKGVSKQLTTNVHVDLMQRMCVIYEHHPSERTLALTMASITLVH